VLACQPLRSIEHAGCAPVGILGPEDRGQIEGHVGRGRILERMEGSASESRSGRDVRPARMPPVKRKHHELLRRAFAPGRAVAQSQPRSPAKGRRRAVRGRTYTLQADV
jgi:hypothetical protein